MEKFPIHKIEVRKERKNMHVKGIFLPFLCLAVFQRHPDLENLSRFFRLFTTKWKGSAKSAKICVIVISGIFWKVSPQSQFSRRNIKLGGHVSHEKSLKKKTFPQITQAVCHFWFEVTTLGCFWSYPGILQRHSSSRFVKPLPRFSGITHFDAWPENTQLSELHSKM